MMYDVLGKTETIFVVATDRYEETIKIKDAESKPRKSCDFSSAMFYFDIYFQ
jgi:hypothetical protein